MNHRAAVVVSFVLLLPLFVDNAAAQSGFAGVVKDASGGVLPGVTVEAKSPALIEGVRTAITDRQPGSTESSTCVPASTPSPSPSPG